MSCVDRRDLLRRALAAGGLAGLGACSSILPGQEPAPRLYTLTPKTTFPPDMPQVQWQLAIDPPFAEAALNTPKIALMRSPTAVEYFARAGWTDRAPIMVQGLLVESFESSRRIVGVSRDSVGLRPDFLIRMELRDFQVEYEGEVNPKVNVRLSVKMVRMPQRVIVGAKEVKRLIPADADTMENVVNAFDEALGKCFKELVPWALATGEKARNEPVRAPNY